MKERLAELIEHHKYAKQECWEALNELSQLDGSKMSEEEKSTLETTKYNIGLEYSLRAMLLEDLKDLQDEH